MSDKNNFRCRGAASRVLNTFPCRRVRAGSVASAERRDFSTPLVECTLIRDTSRSNTRLEVDTWVSSSHGKRLGRHMSLHPYGHQAVTSNHASKQAPHAHSKGSAYKCLSKLTHNAQVAPRYHICHIGGTAHDY